jgi:hypothetical protein
MPYARGGGWHNEMRRIRIRTTDFVSDGNPLDLNNIVAVRLNVGPSWGTNQGRIVIDELMLDNDLASAFTPMTMSLVGQAPEFVPPHVPTTINVEIIEGDDALVAGSTLLHYRYDGGAWNTLPLEQVAGELWRGTLPAPQCGQMLEYYITAAGASTGTVYVPAAGAAAPFVSTVGRYIAILEDNFQSDLGWQVYSAPGTTSGAWERAFPGGWSDGSPPEDFDGSGYCYVTDNRASYDVDGGPTELTSPVLDLSGAGDPVLRFAEWFTCDDPLPPAADFLVCFVNTSDCTNMPPEPQHGSKTTPSLGSSMATRVRTMLAGVEYSPPRLPSELANSPMKYSYTRPTRSSPPWSPLNTSFENRLIRPVTFSRARFDPAKMRGSRPRSLSG